MSPLADLLDCSTREDLKAVWLGLTEQQRRDLRPSQLLADHAWGVLKRTPQRERRRMAA